MAKPNIKVPSNRKGKELYVRRIIVLAMLSALFLSGCSSTVYPEIKRVNSR